MADKKPVLELLEQITEDLGLPGNVRRALKELKENLEKASDDELPVVIDAAAQTLEDLSLDMNLPSYGRVQILNLTTMLEGML